MSELLKTPEGRRLLLDSFEEFLTSQAMTDSEPQYDEEGLLEEAKVIGSVTLTTAGVVFDLGGIGREMYQGACEAEELQWDEEDPKTQTVWDLAMDAFREIMFHQLLHHKIANAENPFLAPDPRVEIIHVDLAGNPLPDADGSGCPCGDDHGLDGE